MTTFAVVPAIGLPSFGGWELLLVLVIVLIIFGPGRLPQVFQSLGRSVKSFRDAQKDDSPDQIAEDSVNRSQVSEAEEVRNKAK